MAPRPDSKIEAKLECLRREVARWNSSFSLVSRKGTRERIDALLDEAAASFHALRTSVFRKDDSPLGEVPRRYHYIDLGSGGGFPGLVWHLLMSESSIPGWTHENSLLVEPREKRAWFLEHTASLMGLKHIEVGADQWGRRTALNCHLDERPVSSVISMKALHLSDEEILAGWRRYRGGAGDSLLICRFSSPAAQKESRLTDSAGLPPVGTHNQGVPWSTQTSFRASGRDLSLLLSLYPAL